MSVIKSYMVSNGGMSFIRHGSTNFSIIDCNIGDRSNEILDEINNEYDEQNDIFRFISTHPDEDC